jgi:hypothetical protein
MEDINKFKLDANESTPDLNSDENLLDESEAEGMTYAVIGEETDLSNGGDSHKQRANLEEIIVEDEYGIPGEETAVKFEEQFSNEIIPNVLLDVVEAARVSGVYQVGDDDEGIFGQENIIGRLPDKIKNAARIFITASMIAATPAYGHGQESIGAHESVPVAERIVGIKEKVGNFLRECKGVTVKIERNAVAEIQTIEHGFGINLKHLNLSQQDAAKNFMAKYPNATKEQYAAFLRAKSIVLNANSDIENIFDACHKQVGEMRKQERQLKEGETMSRLYKI